MTQTETNSPRGLEGRLFPPRFIAEALARKANARAALCLQIAILDVSSIDDVDDDVEEDSTWPLEILSLAGERVLVSV